MSEKRWHSCRHWRHVWRQWRNTFVAWKLYSFESIFISFESWFISLHYMNTSRSITLDFLFMLWETSVADVTSLSHDVRNVYKRVVRNVYAWRQWRLKINAWFEIFVLYLKKTYSLHFEMHLCVLIDSRPVF